MQKKIIYLALIIFISAVFTNIMIFSQKKSKTTGKTKEKVVTKVETKKEEPKSQGPKVTFVELGSVNCIPCKQMQPIMKNIERKYGDQIKVIFHDVWKDDAPAKQYGIKLIPTQVFLDENGKEFFRHEGYYPEKEIDKLLTSKGLKSSGN